jgi:hypothetical protein
MNKTNIITELISQGVDKVNAGYRKYEIKTVSGLKDETGKLWGQTDFDTCKISFEKNMDFETSLEILLHELTHVILDFCGLGSEENEFIRQINNEDLTTIVSRGFMMLMSLNPKLFTIINDHSISNIP